MWPLAVLRLPDTAAVPDVPHVPAAAEGCRRTGGLRRGRRRCEQETAGAALALPRLRSRCRRHRASGALVAAAAGRLRPQFGALDVFAEQGQAHKAVRGVWRLDRLATCRARAEPAPRWGDIGGLRRLGGVATRAKPLGARTRRRGPRGAGGGAAHAECVGAAASDRPNDLPGGSAFRPARGLAEGVRHRGLGRRRRAAAGAAAPSGGAPQPGALAGPRGCR
mmetsp:Transcript_128911/g.412826  ORF Transcript_128911/g.412826 Transcript_128911/m.412826 type:complete len:222 (-) Transcript_128911:959-1624(-)